MAAVHSHSCVIFDSVQEEEANQRSDVVAFTDLRSGKMQGHALNPVRGPRAFSKDGHVSPMKCTVSDSPGESALSLSARGSSPVGSRCFGSGF